LQVRFAPVKVQSKSQPLSKKTEESVEVRRVTLPAESNFFEPTSSHMRTRSASPTVREQTSEQAVPNTGSLDMLLAKYKHVYESNSPSTSLVLDTPRKISKAYDEMFNDTINTNDQSNATTSALASDDESVYKEPVFNKSVDDPVNYISTNAVPNAERDVTNTKRQIVSEQTNQTDKPSTSYNHCPPRLSTHSDRLVLT
jgi:hypothetical protein